MACKAELRRKRLEGLEELVRLTEEFCGYAELESLPEDAEAWGGSSDGSD